MLRINQFGAALLPESKEYVSEMELAASKKIMVGTPLYIGGLPSSVVANNFVNRAVGFTGCLRRYEVASDFKYYALDFASPQIRSLGAGSTACYNNVESGAFFNGSAWIYYGKIARFYPALEMPV